MDWQESDFHHHADQYLESLFEQVEEQDEDGALDIDLEGGVMTIETDDGKQFVINKHAASMEIWLSSPLSGGHHFTPADGGKDWKLADGRRLSIVLSEELSMMTGLTFEIAA